MLCCGARWRLLSLHGCSVESYLAVGEDGGVLSGNRELDGVLYLLYGGSMGPYLDAGVSQ